MPTCSPVHLSAALVVLAQTEGAELPPASIPAWDKDRALTALQVQQVAFDATDGNVMGSLAAARLPSAR